jgi:hypothetical protein
MNNSEERIFNCSHGAGFSPIVSLDPDHINVRKKPIDVVIEFTEDAAEIDTLEGKVLANRGDAIVTGLHGERWPVSRERFLDKYEPILPTVFGQNGSYRSRPRRLLALKMKQRFVVLLSDGVSRLTGAVGDWLLDYGDGSLGIVAARIFVDTYDIVARTNHSIGDE